MTGAVASLFSHLRPSNCFCLGSVVDQEQVIIIQRSARLAKLHLLPGCSGGLGSVVDQELVGWIKNVHHSPSGAAYVVALSG